MILGSRGGPVPRHWGADGVQPHGTGEQRGSSPMILGSRGCPAPGSGEQRGSSPTALGSRGGPVPWHWGAEGVQPHDTGEQRGSSPRQRGAEGVQPHGTGEQRGSSPRQRGAEGVQPHGSGCCVGSVRLLPARVTSSRPARWQLPSPAPTSRAPSSAPSRRRVARRGENATARCQSCPGEGNPHLWQMGKLRQGGRLRARRCFGAAQPATGGPQLPGKDSREPGRSPKASRGPENVAERAMPGLLRAEGTGGRGCRGAPCQRGGRVRLSAGAEGAEGAEARRRCGAKG